MMTVTELTRLINGALEGDGDRAIRAVASIESAGPDDITFLANVKYERHVATTGAAAVIVGADYAGATPKSSALIRCADPYFAFREAMVALHGFREPHFKGIDPAASIDPSATLGPGVRVGAFASIGPRGSIAAATVIYPGVHIGPDCIVGADCRIYSNVTIYDGTIIGQRVTIHANSSIGQDGFGYATHDGRHCKIPPTGCVIIEDDVEIGACCAIDRATVGSTIIGAGTKMSNQVAIGHGTRLGKCCLLVAQVGIAGSTEVGNYCVFAGQAGIVGHIRIGDGARIGAQAGVSNDIPSGLDVLGTPAIPLAQARRAMMSQTRLPQIRTAVRRLSRELSTLKRQLKQDDPSNADEPTTTAGENP